MSKTIRLVEFLSRVAGLRMKIGRDLADYEKTIWLGDIPYQVGCYCRAWGGGEEHELWIEVQSQNEPKLEKAPEACRAWVTREALYNTDKFPELATSITESVPNPEWSEGSDEPEKVVRTRLLKDEPALPPLWEKYLEDKWMPWAESHKVWEKSHKIYTEFFAIHQEFARLGEEYELVLGLGLIKWITPSGQRVRRHLLVADAALTFEATSGKFTVEAPPDGAKLRHEIDMLAVEEQPIGIEEAAKEKLAAGDDDPWNKSMVSGVLKALAHSMKGEYEESVKPQSTAATTTPTVEYAPALILRKRSAKGLTDALKRIMELIESGVDVPLGFAALAEKEDENGGENVDPGIDGAPDQPGIFDGEIYFPKHSNEAQRQIVGKIRSGNGVVVQGPPGTGKSHTIANLISHLLAQGQRILVTAKTPRALKVLEHQLPEAIRPLCINLLGSGLEEKKSLESSVAGIMGKTNDWNERQAARDIVAIEGDLSELRQEKNRLDHRIRSIRESETHSQTVAEGCYRGTAARIVEEVNRKRSTYEWFTDEVDLNESCPIAPDELTWIRNDLKQFTDELRDELALSVLDFPFPEGEFTARLQEERQVLGEIEKIGARADEHAASILAACPAESIQRIQASLTLVREAKGALVTTGFSWIPDAIRDVITGQADYWSTLLRVSAESIKKTEHLAELADAASVEYPQHLNAQALLNDARELKRHMEAGGGLGWGPFRPGIVKERLYLLKEIRLNGQFCSTSDDFSVLADLLHVSVEVDKVWSYWQERNPRTSGPFQLQLATIKGLREALEKVLSLDGIIARCRDAINSCTSLGEPVWTDDQEIEKLVESCRLALSRIRLSAAQEGINAVEAPISSLVSQGGVHPDVYELLKGIQERNPDMVGGAIRRIAGLEQSRTRLRKLDVALEKLRSKLPNLSEDLVGSFDNPCWVERIPNIADAWHWAQARYWVEDFIRREDLPALALRSKQLEEEILRKIARLASIKAWDVCAERLDEKPEYRQHMVAWENSMKRLGKGTGKYAAVHRRNAQEHLNACREAVPAWVMPLHRVWDTISPQSGMFDVVIVDEASQCGLEALPLLFLGKKILIVGDDKQISPENPGLSPSDVHRLMDQYLEDFKQKSEFDINSSLFDHGKRQYGKSRITLREHFRCMPEIIRFSNDLCYSKTPLIPLRQYGPNRLKPLEHYYVDGGYREGKDAKAINRVEAAAIAEKIAEHCADSAYEGKSMGVIVLQGEAQAALIEEMLLERIGALEMERRSLVCGNPYSFQGDERDVVYLSLVAAPNMRIGALTKPADERRFNVAASRACESMILFHSVTCDDLSIHDLRRKLLEFFQTTKPVSVAGIARDELERRAQHDNRSIVNAPDPFDSWFEVDVALEILRRNYTVIPQYEVAGKYIDLVVEGGRARLAVECDGSFWHGADQYDADMDRQRQLERSRWEFFRITESQFYANKDSALNGLWELLDARGIYPGYGEEDPAPSSDSSQHAEELTSGIEDNPSIDVDSNELDTETSTDSVDEGDITSSPAQNEHRTDAVSSEAIAETIVDVLANCPNRSCTVDSLGGRVLKSLGILTRGKPRQLFERRVMRACNALEEQGVVEKYKATNHRVRLL